MEKMWLLPYLKKAKVWNHLYVLVLVLFSFVLFASEDMETLLFNVKGMVGLGGVPAVTAATLYYLRSYAVIFVIAFVGSTPLFKRALGANMDRRVGERAVNVAEPIVLTALLLVMTGYLVDGSFSPFLYFRF
jgi:alginate O-acetyltransferase complex protein AlgI